MTQSTRHLLALLCMAGAVTAALAKESDADTQQDIARHRAIAAAHEAAAKCREAGKDEQICAKQLEMACKGIAIGKYCGMKHEH